MNHNHSQQSGACILIQAMRKILEENNLREATLVGKLVHDGRGAPKMQFPGGVYGFSVILTPTEKMALFHEAQARGLSNIENIEEFKPICGNQYPLYWGKDKYIGQRLHSHLAGCNKYQSTGLIRLRTYESLIGREIYCGVVIVEDKDKIERLLTHLYHYDPRLGGICSEFCGFSRITC